MESAGSPGSAVLGSSGPGFPGSAVLEIAEQSPIVALVSHISAPTNPKSDAAAPGSSPAPGSSGPALPGSAVLESAEPVDLSQYVALLSYVGVPKEKPVDVLSLHFVWHSTTPRKDGTLWPATRISLMMTKLNCGLHQYQVIVNRGPRHGSWQQTPDGFEICWNCHGNELKTKRSVFKYLAPTNVLLQVNNRVPYQGILIPVGDARLERCVEDQPIISVPSSALARNSDTGTGARPIISVPVAAPRKRSGEEIVRNSESE